MSPALWEEHSQSPNTLDEITAQNLDARFYMSCFQLTVGGSGSANPPTVSIPGAYSAEDPGILINIYTQLNSYVSEYSSHSRQDAY